MTLHIVPLFTYHNSVGRPSSQLILCAYDRTLDTKCSLSSSPAPTATFAMISFSSVFPSTSMWSPEFGPPRRLHASGECLICSTWHERRRNGHLTQLASYVMTFTPAGFQRLRLQPSAHMAPREVKVTVPSPSPIRTPFLTCSRISMESSRCLWQFVPLVWTYHSLTRCQSNLIALLGSRDSDCILLRQINIVLEIRLVGSRHKCGVLGCT